MATTSVSIGLAGAIMVMSAAGCGGDGASPGPLTVRSESVECREPLRWAGINRADGTVVDGALLLTDGPVSAEVMPGDWLTAGQRAGVGGALAMPTLSVMAVEPGDDLAVGWRCSVTAVAGASLVEWSEVAGATHYRVCSACSCQDTVTPMLSSWIGLCADDDPGHEDLMVTAFAGERPVAFAWRAGAPVVVGDSVAAGPWKPQVSTAIRITSLPGPPPYQTTFELHNGEAPVVIASLSIDAVPSTAEVPAPADGPPLHMVTSFGQESLVFAVPAGTATSKLTAPALLPTVTAAAYDRRTRRVSFWLDGDTPYDLAEVRLGWRTPEGTSPERVFVVPSGVTSFELPFHPGVPGAADDLGAPTAISVQLSARDDVDSYDDIRRAPLWQALDASMIHTDAPGLMRWVARDF